MRAEAALRCGQIRDAVLATFSFRDAALIDYISRLDFVDELSELRQTIFAKKEGPNKLLTNPAEGEPWQRCLHFKRRERGKTVYRFRTGTEYDKYWFEVLGAVAEPLKVLTDKLQTGDPSPKNVRNFLTHNILPPNQMAHVRDKFVSSGIWMPKHEGFFLQHEPVAHILKGFGIEQPIQLYLDLVNGLIGAMESYKMN